MFPAPCRAQLSAIGVAKVHAKSCAFMGVIFGYPSNFSGGWQWLYPNDNRLIIKTAISLSQLGGSIPRVFQA